MVTTPPSSRCGVASNTIRRNPRIVGSRARPLVCLCTWTPTVLDSRIISFAKIRTTRSGLAIRTCERYEEIVERAFLILIFDEWAFSRVRVDDKDQHAGHINGCAGASSSISTRSGAFTVHLPSRKSPIVESYVTRKAAEVVSEHLRPGPDIYWCYQWSQ